MADLDYIDERMQRRRQIAFGILIGLIIVFSVVYYFWGNLINRGSLLVYAEPPFTVEFYELKQTSNCDKSPCKISQKMGNQGFVVIKDGHESVFSSAYIKLWGATEVKIELKGVPHLAKVDTLPGALPSSYSLIIDDKNNMQKLVRKDDKEAQAIVYFPKQLKEPEVYGVGNLILIIDKGSESLPVYKVNVSTGKKQLIESTEQLKNMIGGRYSNDGKYFVFSALRQPNLWMIDDQNEIKELDVQANIQDAAWTADNQLVMTTRSSTDPNVPGYDFSEYNPLSGAYKAIASFPELTIKPTNLTPLPEKGIYFQSGESFYQLILE
jgi:hypothetical protein